MKFLEKICKESLNLNPVRTLIILPSQRSAVYLREEYKKLETTAILPEIMTMDNFVQRISGILPEDNLKIAAIAYKEFIRESENKLYFDEFLLRFEIMLKDFNDIDMYLLDSGNLGNVKEAAELEHAEKGTLAKHYFDTMKMMEKIYTTVKENLLKERRGYRGMIYREAAEGEIQSGDFDNVIIAGFNILTPSEIKLIDFLIKEKRVKLFFDIPEKLLQAKHESAGFIASHLERWAECAENFDEDINEKIEIRSYSLPVDQTDILSEVFSSGKGTVVLCDETLMMPVINGLPETADKINITMGYPLIQTPIARFVIKILRMHSERTKRGFYYKDVLDLIDSAYSKRELGEHYYAARGRILSCKSSYVEYEDVFKGFKSNMFDKVFVWYDEEQNLLPVKIILNKLSGAVSIAGSSGENDLLSESNSVKIVKILNKLLTLLEDDESIIIKNDAGRAAMLLERMIAGESVPFSGDPLQEFQVMGMLESRCLEFEKTAVLSVNEGIMPKGKNFSSFIPSDLRELWGLPTYRHTDALFSYYFYSVLFKSKEFYAVYAEGGEENYNEKSRFIEQILWESRKGGIFEGRVNVSGKNYEAESLKGLTEIEKTERIIAKLKKMRYSPTSLISFMSDPIKFFFESVLRIWEENERDEVRANIIGTAAHEALQIIYEKNRGVLFSKENVFVSDALIEKMIIDSFAKNKISNTESGKPYLMKRVVMEMIKNFVKSDTERAHDNIKLFDLEGELKGYVEVNGNKIELYGKFDRIEERENEIKICDYKSGMAEKSELKIYDRENPLDFEKWREKPMKYAKTFQLLFYGYLAYNDLKFSGKRITMAIYSLRKPREVFDLEYATGEKVIFDEKLNEKFEALLKRLLGEILDANNTFIKAAQTE